eukprot:GHVL01002713.1.p1 GENE.GHVL01002713.1~~GHVL01002713.1.p1  ORF type:complete len:182 (+),score=27.28 GHVL01002713.1:1258-1803(+)
MKLEKTSSGNIIIKSSSDEIQHIIATDVLIQLHPRNDKAVILSKTPTNQDEEEGIVLYADQVTEVDGNAYGGSRQVLMTALSTVFNIGGADGEGSGFSGDYNDLENKPNIPININISSIKVLDTGLNSNNQDTNDATKINSWAGNDLNTTYISRQDSNTKIVFEKEGQYVSNATANDEQSF